MPRWLSYSLIVLATLALIPFACVARARAIRSPLPRFHVIYDMDNQGRFDTQSANRLFVDQRAMRLPVAGTVTRGRLQHDDARHLGTEGGEFTSDFPLPLTEDLLRRGRERYGVYCSPCHGLAGYGDGMVARRAEQLKQGTWVPPSSLHDELVRSRPVGHLFNTISNGIRTMPAYGYKLTVDDRWAVAAFVRALQRSQRTEIEDVPPQHRAALQ